MTYVLFSNFAKQAYDNSFRRDTVILLVFFYACCTHYLFRASVISVSQEKTTYILRLCSANSTYYSMYSK